MQINFVYDSSVASAPAGFKQGLVIAANIIDSIILNPITVNIDIGFGEDNGSALPANTLGEAQPAFGVLLSYSQVLAGLTGAATSADDAQILQNLPATDPSNGLGFFVSVAQATVWGVLPASPNQIDGYAGFSSTLSFTYDPANGIAAGTVDFVGVALHELTHALGRNFTTTWPTLLDLLSYNSSGKLDINNADARYLSFDGGKTHLANRDVGSDPADFASFGPVDPFNAAIGRTTLYSWTTLDSRVMDALGYRVIASASAAQPPKTGSNFSVLDTTSNTTSRSNGDVYTGPVAGLKFQLLSTTSDSVNITSSVSNVFIHSGPGSDALSVANVAGRNVLDGGAGSNFMVGSLDATARDTFFVDDRNATADIWSTVLNMHAGDSATVWGLTPTDFTAAWADGEGAPGFQGLTLHASEASKPKASLTLAGFTTADLRNGHLAVSFGSVGGNNFLNISAQG